MRLYRLPKGNIPADYTPAGPPRFVRADVTPAGLVLRAAEVREFLPAGARGDRPDRVVASYLFDVHPDPSDPGYVVCQVADVVVRLPHPGGVANPPGDCGQVVVVMVD